MNNSSIYRLFIIIRFYTFILVVYTFNICNISQPTLLFGFSFSIIISLFEYSFY